MTATITALPTAKPMPARPGDAILVHWRDAASDHGWKEDHEVEHEPVEVVTVGILVKQTRKAITVALSKCDKEGVNGTMVIPAAWATERRVLARREDI